MNFWLKDAAQTESKTYDTLLRTLNTEVTFQKNRCGTELFKSEDPKHSPRVIRLDCLVLSTEIWLAAAALPVGGTLLYWPEEVYCCAFAAPELAANAAARLALTKVLYKNPNISL